MLRPTFRPRAWLAAALAGGAALASAADAPDAPLPALRFAELWRRPIGPRGLEPTERLLGLRGARVGLVGFAAQGAEPTPGLVILTARPVRLGDEDEALADDLPAQAVYVHTAADRPALADDALHCRGPVGVVGTLELGARREADDRISYVRLRAESLRCLPPATP